LVPFHNDRRPQPGRRLDIHAGRCCGLHRQLVPQRVYDEHRVTGTLTRPQIVDRLRLPGATKTQLFITITLDELRTATDAGTVVGSMAGGELIGPKQSGGWPATRRSSPPSGAATAKSWTRAVPNDGSPQLS